MGHPSKARLRTKCDRGSIDSLRPICGLRSLTMAKQWVGRDRCYPRLQNRDLGTREDERKVGASALQSPMIVKASAGAIEGSSISQTGDGSPGIGLALKSFLHWRAVHRAHALDFLRRALSVEIPVPAYICR